MEPINQAISLKMFFERFLLIKLNSRFWGLVEDNLQDK